MKRIWSADRVGCKRVCESCLCFGMFDDDGKLGDPVLAETDCMVDCNSGCESLTWSELMITWFATVVLFCSMLVTGLFISDMLFLT